jgi:His/Glu/Gln/Arg/opine family amino acid ABC transporter permease subunit
VRAIPLGLLVLSTLVASFPGVSRAAESPLRVGLTGKYPPFNFFDSAGKLAGFDVEVASALCLRIHRPCDFKILPWDGILAALLSNKIDVVIGSMAITQEREKQANFTDPYYESGAQLFVKDENADPDQEGFRIGVTLGTTYGEFAKKRFPKAETRTYKGDTEIFQDLESGRLDGMVTDRLVGAYMNQVRQAGLRMKGPLLYRERMGIPVRRSDPELRSRLNEALREFLASPEYAAIHARYFGEGALEKSPAAGDAGFNWSGSLRLLAGAWASTIALSAEGLFLGGLLSLILAFLLIYPPAWIRRVVLVYVDFVRSTPFMIQLFAIYFGLPAIGIRLPAWESGVLAIALHLSSYLSETIKVAYRSIPPGQHHAAQVLGLGRASALRHVILPQMFPLLLAPTLNTVVAMIKDSAIVSVISVHELTMQTQQLISSTFRPLEFYGISAVLYALITYPLLILGRKLEARYREKGLLHGHA